MEAHHNGSFWFDSLETLPPPLAPEKLPPRVQVAIIGGGFTGLWTAYYLNRADPSLDIAVFEANTVGFGASGRNGGWCMGTAMGIDAMLLRDDRREAGLALAHAMQDTVDEVGRVCQAENIDCHFRKGGTLTVAPTAFHAEMLAEAATKYPQVGLSAEDHVFLPADESRRRIGMAPNFGAMYTPHCAAIHPARLVRGLGDVLRNKGVRIFEKTPVLEIKQGAIVTSLGDVAADKILRATEGYTDSIRGQTRQLLPLYSMMVATEPLPEAVWEQIGLRNAETFGDMRRIVIYGQRTLDNRLAFGGRAGYYFGSGIRPRIDPADPAVRRVERILKQILPVVAEYRITHGWGGLMGAPRKWQPFVCFDDKTGFGRAGGYTGEGVGASNLAGRTLADLALGRETLLTGLDWVNNTPARWEPEPLRWIGAKGIQFFGDLADRAEFASGRPSRFWGKMFGYFV